MVEVEKYSLFGGIGGEGPWGVMMRAGVNNRVALLAFYSALLLPEEMNDWCV